MQKSKLPKDLPKGYIFLFITTLLWSAGGPVIKYTLSYIPPLTFLFLRFLIVCIIFLPYTIYEVQKVKVDPRDYFNLFLLGIFSQSSIALIFIALKYTTSIDNATIGILGAVLSIAAGSYFYKEKISKNLKIGLVLSSIGTLIIVIEPLFLELGNTELLDRLFGNTLLLIYNFFWVFFVIWSKMSMGEESKLLEKTLSFIRIKPMKKSYPPTLITALSMFVGLFTIAPLSILEMTGAFGEITNFNIMEIDPKGIFGLLYMAIFSSIVAYVLYQKAISIVKVSDLAFFHYLSPVLTIPFSYLLLKEIPTTLVIIGSVFIAIGIYIAEKNGAD